MKRLCLKPGCTRITTSTYCYDHTTHRPGARYGYDHQRIAAQVLKEEKVCRLCGLPATPTDPLEAGHILPRALGGQTIRSNYRAEHRSHNRAEGARLARALKGRTA